MPTQQCGRCKEAVPIELFSPSYRGKAGTWCRPCFAAHARGEPRQVFAHPPRPCVVCGTAYVPKQLKSKSQGVCSRACSQRFRNETGLEREKHLRRKYGLTLADYDRMLAEQGGGCAICGVRPQELVKGRYRTYLHVDHDAETGKVRGLLCPDHNLMLGRWNHDPALLRRAVKYLEAKASI